VELDPSVTGSKQAAANFLDGRKKRATHSSRTINDKNAGDVTVGHVTVGNGQYFILDADAVNREAFLSSHQRNLLQ